MSEANAPTLMGSISRYRVLVIGSALAGLLLGVALPLLSPPTPSYSAESSMIVQAPSTSFEGSDQNTDRFVANQVQILRSGAVNQRAAEILTDLGVHGEVPAAVVEASTLSIATPDTNLITVTYVAPRPELAVAGANALLQAFDEVSTKETSDAASSAQDRIDAELTTVRTRRREIEVEIAELRDTNSELSTLERQIDDLVLELTELQAASIDADDDEELSTIEERRDQIREWLETLEFAREAASQQPAVVALLQEDGELIGREADLVARQDQIAIDSDLAPSTVLISSEADFASASSGPSRRRVAAVGLLLGAAVGVGLAYLLASRRRIYVDRSEPERSTGSVLLADIPDFREEGIETQLPIKDRPITAAAEAFRFASDSLAQALRTNQSKVAMAVSPVLGSGKTTIVANIGIVLAREGKKVAVIDADFGHQSLTGLLADSKQPDSPGITDVTSGKVRPDEALQRIDVGSGLPLNLISRGGQPGTASDALSTEVAEHLFGWLSKQFDIVLVDGPPMAQVAYASTLARLSQNAFMVIPHGSSALDAEQVSKRLEFLKVGLLGYVYNRSPLRSDMRATEGSMRDILGNLPEHPQSPRAPIAGP